MTDDPEIEYDPPAEPVRRSRLGIDLEPVEGPRITCPDCGSQFLGRGTLTHNDNGSHEWTPEETQ